MTSPYGAHLSGGRDLRPSAEVAERFGFEVFQVFLHGPTSGKMPQGTEEDDREFRSTIEEAGRRVFVHGPYLMNFGSAKESVRKSSVDMLRKNMRRAERIGAEGVIFHGGSSTGASLEEGLNHLHETLLPVLEEFPEDGPKVILEPTAGQGSSLVSTVDSIPAYLDVLEDHPLLELCLDTCHLLAAGEPLDETEGIIDTLQWLHNNHLWDRIALFHSNDSKGERGSHRDLHANLGYGHCSPELWRHLMATGIPLILETPGEHFMGDLEILQKTKEKEKER